MTDYRGSLHSLKLFFLDCNEEGKVAMERNLAYELHKPRARHKQTPKTPIYEDVKHIS